ncbi:2OG-Fe(II) oxygenase family protein [Nocardia sp. NPDC003979]
MFDTVDGFKTALSDGFFALAIPDNLDVDPGKRFCRQFHLPLQGNSCNDAYRGFRERSEVYFSRQNFQIEHVLTEGSNRKKYLPADVCAMAEMMTDIALLIFRSTLSELGIPERVWAGATSGAVDGHGAHWFVAHHYRGNRDQMGCAPHKDTGFVTVLYADQPGLEVYRAGKWVSVDPLPGHFIVNFGQSMDVLTSSLAYKVDASMHRVRTFPSENPDGDRVSFAAFVDPPHSGNLYRIRDDWTTAVAVDIEEFLRANNEAVWDDHEDFGIVGAEG